jgi:hypothetical protein
MRRAAIVGFTVRGARLRVPDPDGRSAGRDAHTEKILDLTLKTAILRPADESPGSSDETRNRSNPYEPNRCGLEK